MITEDEQNDAIQLEANKKMCERSHLNFTRYFFRHRQNMKFIINWHHELISDELEKIITGETENLVITVPPGSSKTEMCVINFIAKGLTVNPRSRFLHLSYSDELALLNSQTARDVVTSDEFQELWRLKISPDAKSKSRWNVMVDDRPAGGVYATSIGGQITGFRAGHMTEEFSGCIILDDLLKPDDAFSKTKLNAANRKLLTVVKSRKANPKTPIILIMQRLSDEDPVAFIKNGNLPGKWKFVTIPALIDDAYVKALPAKYKAMISDSGKRDAKGRFSYWQYKEPLEDLLSMERGDGKDQTGSRMSRHVFASQYMQNPVAIGGNIIKGEWFKRYTVLPRITGRYIFADTAQKTKEANDFSVFALWGAGDDGKIYLLDLIKGKWEAPELKKTAIAFWAKHSASQDYTMLGKLREMIVEDKSSGTGLIQEIRRLNHIPIKGVERVKDKLTRVMDVVAHIEAGMVCIPEDAPFTHDFVAECEAFTSDDSHAHDDQIDTMCDAIVKILSVGSKLKIWEKMI